MGRGNPQTFDQSMPNSEEIIVDQTTPNGDTPKGEESPSSTQPEPTKKEEPEKKFTKRERLEFTKAKIEKQLEELDGEEDDTRPLTVGEFKKMQREEVRKSAVELAGSIEDQDEREEVISILETRIVPSGKAEDDLKLARDMVNARKNAQIAEDMARKTQPNTHSSRPANPGHTPQAFTPTAEELTFMQPPYNLTKEQIIEARKKNQ